MTKRKSGRGRTAKKTEAAAPDDFGPFPDRKAFDAVANWMTGQGGVNDPASATRFLYAATESWQEIRNMVRAQWLARKVVWKKPQDMLRPGYDLVWEGLGEKEKGKKNTDGDRVRSALMRKWAANAMLVKVMAMGREFGGAVLVPIIKGQLLKEPLPVKNGQVDYSSITKGSLQRIFVFDRWRATHNGQIDNDMNSPNCGNPMSHMLTGVAGGLAGQEVHWTRVLRFGGDEVDEYTRISNAYWDDSVLQVVIEPIKQYSMLTSAITSLVPKARQEIIYAEKAAAMAATASGQQQMAARYAAAHRLASLWNVLVLDMKTEKSEQRTFNFGGLDKIWEKAMKEIAGAFGYPVSVLFGDEPAGLNATGDASLRNYYDNLAAERDNTFKAKHLTLLEWIVRDELGSVPDGFDVVYRPFWEPTAMEKATINKTRAEADHIRIDDQVITPGLAARETKEDSLYRSMTQEDVDNAALKVPEPEEGQPVEEGLPGSEKGSAMLALTPTMQGAIVTVNQALAQLGLPEWPDGDGVLTIAEFQAKHAAVIAKAVNAEAGSTGEKPVVAPPTAGAPPKPPVLGRKQ
jgi:hypothetical protein